MAELAGQRPNGYELLQENLDIILREDGTYLMWDGVWDFYVDPDEVTGTDATVDHYGPPEGFLSLRIIRNNYTLEILR